MNIPEIKSAVEQCLAEFWDLQALAVDKTSESIDDLIDPMDSLAAVDVLIDVGNIVGMQIPEGRVIRRGGYDTRGQFIDDLTGRVLDYVKEQTT